MRAHAMTSGDYRDQEEAHVHACAQAQCSRASGQLVHEIGSLFGYFSSRSRAARAVAGGYGSDARSIQAEGSAREFYE